MNGLRLVTAMAVLSAVSACTGPNGPAGAAGSNGEAGAQGTAGPMGPLGPIGPTGTGSLDGSVVSIPVSCLSPCHGFNGVVAQFQTSVHYTEYLANVASATPETEWTTTGAACGNCHAIDGLQQRVTGNVGTTRRRIVVNLASGELQYRDSDDRCAVDLELHRQRHGRRGVLHDVPRGDRRRTIRTRRASRGRPAPSRCRSPRTAAPSTSRGVPRRQR